MTNGKLDNALNLALQTSEPLRENAHSLDTGYLPEEKSWELIVKYTGKLSTILEEFNIRGEELLSNYAILIVEEQKIEALSNQNNIEYIEKPFPLIFASTIGMEASCIPFVQLGPKKLTGEGVIVAIIDSGMDYSHPDFRKNDGSTRILYYWDQSIPGTPPNGYMNGSLYTSEDLNAALAITDPGSRLNFLPSIDATGHGTHVAGIACGNGATNKSLFQGVAPACDIIAVKLGTPLNNSFPRTTQLMSAIDFCIRTATSLGKPIAINLSFGNNYGSHDGHSLLEQYINDVSMYWKSSIIVGTGNEGTSGKHTNGIIEQGKDTYVEIAVPSNELSFSLQIWKNYYDTISLEIISPKNIGSGFISPILGKQDFFIDDTEILLYYAPPNPINKSQEIYVEFIPHSNTLTIGIWKLHLLGQNIISGNYDMWLPSGSKLISNTRFTNSTSNTTLTIPSTAYHAISVSAYDAYTNKFAAFSGQGYTRFEPFIKPDICAPGVNIVSTDVNGGYSIRSGTSMATPFVTGSAALLMEWGIVKGNDPYLYGEKVKAYLVKGAKHLPAYNEYPNPQIGWGALCVKNSIPGY